MIYEYALDPQFIVDISDKNDLANHLCQSMGAGHCCIVAGYPEKLGALVGEILEKQLAKAKEKRHIASLQQRLHSSTELARSLTQITTKRYGANVWSGCFNTEHGRLPFEGILSPSAETPVSSSLPLRTIEWLRNKDCHIFTCPQDDLVQRNEAALIKALKPLLQNASEITFVDPYFYPDYRPRYERPYKIYFELLSNVAHVRSTGTRLITIIVAVNNGQNSLNPKDFSDDCCNLLPPWLPDDKIQLAIHRIAEKPGGQQIHNRYILTDIGGVSFGHGTDIALDNPSSFDSVSLLGAESLAVLKNAYRPNSPHFDWSEPGVIISK